MREDQSEGRIGRAVMTLALVAATALLVLAVVTLIGLTVQRQDHRGESMMQQPEALQAAPPERGPFEREQPLSTDQP